MTIETSSTERCEICGKVRHCCDVCKEICAGCIADKKNPQSCKLCRNQGFIGNIRSGPLSTCPDCGKGYRLKLWIAHEKRRGRAVPAGFIELAS